jgi:hypothetical protein
VKAFDFDTWKEKGHPNCFLEDGTEIRISSITFFGGKIEMIFYNLKNPDGYTYLKSPFGVFMEDK